MSADAQRYAVYFREEHLPQAYAFAAELEGEGRQRAEPVAHDDSGMASIVGWSRDQIERAYVESPLGMKLLFDGMIDHPNEVLDSADMARYLTHKPDADAVTVRGTMGAFANRCSLRYDRKKRDFPFEHWYVEGGRARYRMSAAVADILRPLRDAKRY